MKWFLFGLGIGIALSFLALCFLPTEIFYSKFEKSTSSLISTHCPSTGTIELAATKTVADFGKGFTIWEKETDPIAGEKLEKWIKAETRVNEYLKIGVTLCTYESVALYDGSPRNIVIATYGTRLDHMDFINDSNWDLENKVKPNSGENADNWKFTCVNSRTTCLFDLHS